MSNFKIKNGVLIKYDGVARNVVIPNGVTAIGEEAFQDNIWIKSVTIPYGVTIIDYIYS